MSFRRWGGLLCGLCVAVASCGGGGLRGASSGQIGCSPEEVQVLDHQRGWSSVTWTAICRGRTFYCSGGGKDISCREDMSNAAVAGPYGSFGSPGQAMGPGADPTNQVVSFLYDLRMRNYPMAVARMTLSFAGTNGSNGLQAAVERVPDLAGHTGADAPRNQVSLTPGPPLISVQRGTISTSDGPAPFAAELRFEGGIFRISRLWIRDEEVLSDGSPRQGP